MRPRCAAEIAPPPTRQAYAIRRVPRCMGRRRDCPTTDTPGIRHLSRAAVNGPPRCRAPSLPRRAKGCGAPSPLSSEQRGLRDPCAGESITYHEDVAAGESAPPSCRSRQASRAHQCRHKRARPLAPRRTSRPRIDHAVNGYHACAPAAPVPPSVQTKRSSNRGEARTTHAMDSTPGGLPEATGRDTTDATMRNVGSPIILSHARRTRNTHSTRATSRFMPKRHETIPYYTL